MEYGNASDVDAARARLGQLQQGQWFKLKSGDNHIRFLPPWAEGVRRFYYETVVHFNIGNTMVVCPNRSPITDEGTGKIRPRGEKCYICETIERLSESNDPDVLKRVQSIGPKLRILFNIMDINNPGLGAQLLSTGPQIFEQLLGYFVDPKWGNFTDPDKGYNINIVKSGTGFNTEYQVRPDRDVSAIENKSVLESMSDLSKVAQERTYEEVKALFHGTALPPSEQQGSSGTDTSPPTSVDSKPKCFGEYEAGDNVCEHCKTQPDCKAKVSGGADEQKEEVSKPKCFGNNKFFDAGSESCKKCMSYEACAVEIKSKL